MHATRQNSRRGGRESSAGKGSKNRNPVQDAEKRALSAPVMRIARFVAKDTINKDEWRDYLEDLATENRHLKFKNLGGMACTYLESRELNRMLADRYDDYGRDRKTTTSVQRGLSRTFREFVRTSEKYRRENEEETVLTEHFWRRPGSPALEIPAKDLTDMWGKATISTKRDLSIAKSHSMVMDLSDDNLFLWEEMDAVRDFLKNEEHLKLKYLRNPEQVPHITLLNTSRKLEDTAFIPLLDQMPGELTLAAPKLWCEPGNVPCDQQAEFGVL